MGVQPIKRVEYRIELFPRAGRNFLGAHAGTSAVAPRHLVRGEKKGKTRNIEHSRRDNAGRKNWGREPDLGSQVVYVVENCLIRRIVETTLNSRSFIFCESRT